MFTNKTLLIISSIVLVLIIGLGSFSYWQKNNIPELKQNSSTINKQIEKKSVTKETKMDLTKKQTIINKIIPESDLDELNVPDTYIQNGQLAGLAVMRAGKIIEIDKEKQSFTFLNEFMGEKKYTVLVDKNTKIEINVFETVFANAKSEKPLKEKRYNEDGTFNDLKINQNINIIASNVINGDKFTAKEIIFKKYNTKILN